MSASEPRLSDEERARRIEPQRCEYAGPLIFSTCEHPACHDLWQRKLRALAAEFAEVRAEASRELKAALEEQIAASHKNAKDLAKYPGEELEARAREMAACYLEEVSILWKLRGE